MTDLERALLEFNRSVNAVFAAARGLRESVSVGPANIRSFANMVEKRSKELADAARIIANNYPPALEDNNKDIEDGYERGD